MRTVGRSRIALLLSGLLLALPALAQDRPGTLRGLLGGRGDEEPAALERTARAERDAARAERTYATLFERHPETAEGVRAALWLGKRLYGLGREEQALAYFEEAGRGADPVLRAEALFWAEQIHRLTGQEPLPAGDRPASGGYWDALRLLVLVDRSLARARPEEAESRLLSLEGSLRRHGLLGLDLARWGRLAQRGGGRRVDSGDLRPLLRETLALSERLAYAPGPGAPEPAAEVWSLQFGAFLERGNARELLDRLRGEGFDARIDGAIDEPTEASAAEGMGGYAVRLGRFSTRAEADSAALSILERQAPPVRVVRVR